MGIIEFVCAFVRRKQATPLVSAFPKQIPDTLLEFIPRGLLLIRKKQQQPRNS